MEDEMTTIFIRYHSNEFLKQNSRIENFFNAFLAEVQNTANITSVLRAEAIDTSSSIFPDFLNLLPGEFLYIPLISKNLVLNSQFRSEINNILLMKGDAPENRILIPLGLEHIDTSIFSQYYDNLDLSIRIMSLYVKMRVLDTQSEETTANNNNRSILEGIINDIYNDALILRSHKDRSLYQSRNQQGFSNTETSSGQYGDILGQKDISPLHSRPVLYSGVPERADSKSFPLDSNYGSVSPHHSNSFTTDASVEDENSSGVVYFNLRKRIVVAKDGSGDYRSLVEAIRKANDGSTIIVRPGSYDAPPQINKSLSIIGERELSDKYSEKAELILKGPAPIKCLSYKSDVKSVTSFIKMKNLIIRQPQAIGYDEVKGSCIYAEDCNLTIQECIVTGGSYGLYAGRDSFVRTLGGVFTSSKKANILIESLKKVEIQHTQISNSEGDGIFIMWSAQPIISGCYISGNKHNGINIQADSGARIRECKIVENEKCGIVSYIGSYCDLAGSEVCNNNEFGVNLHFRHRGSATDNRITGNRLGPKEVTGNKISGDFKNKDFIWIRNKEK